MFYKAMTPSAVKVADLPAFDKLAAHFGTLGKDWISSVARDGVVTVAFVDAAKRDMFVQWADAHGYKVVAVAEAAI